MWAITDVSLDIIYILLPIYNILKLLRHIKEDSYHEALQ